MRADVQHWLTRLAGRDPQVLADKITADRLAVLAHAVGVPKTGRKTLVAARVVARADLLLRLDVLPDEPVALARVMRRDALLALAKELGCYTGLNKYGLAATIIGARTNLGRRFAAALDDTAPDPTADAAPPVA